jgi:hypothetical protein
MIMTDKNKSIFYIDFVVLMLIYSKLSDTTSCHLTTLHCHFHLILDVFLQRDSAAALMYAAASGHDPIVSLLLAGKSVIDQADKVRLFLD